MTSVQSSLADRATGSRPAAAMGRWATSTHLRVLAMHGISDLDAFEQQLALLLEWFRPVSAAQVASWQRGGSDLPANALWLTFDDGARSTVVNGIDLLHHYGVPATVFVCPGLVDQATVPWWDTVLNATSAEHPVEVDGRWLSGPDAVTALKQVPDLTRRTIIGRLSSGATADSSATTIEDLERWRSLGGDIGNHTWDHPCLDRCSPDAQRFQIDQAAEWLDRHGLWDRRVFAYPNGDRTEVAERHLGANGYELVALFDHALASRRQGALRVSRLRLDAGAPATRTSAVTSGWHGPLLRLRRRRTSVPRP